MHPIYRVQISKLPTRQLTQSILQERKLYISKLPTRQLTYETRPANNPAFSKLPTRQLTVTKLLQNQNTNTVLLISPYFTL